MQVTLELEDQELAEFLQNTDEATLKAMFSIRRANAIEDYNEETQRTIKESEEGKNINRYKSPEDMFKALGIRC